MMAVTSGKASFTEALAQRPIGVFQLTLVLLLLLVLIIDGIDIQLLSLVAPVILEDWDVQQADFGPALAGALIGMSLGSLAGGALGDRYGRLRVLAVSVFAFGLATVAAGMTDSVAAMTALRIASGIGFGAAAPNAIALATDWLPERARPKVTSIMSIGTPAGGMVGASIVLILLPLWGWRGTFVACGALTIALATAVLLFLRESPSYLAAKGRSRDAREVARRRLGLNWDPSGTSAQETEGVIRPRGGFLNRANLRLNIGAGFGFFCIAFVSYALVAWTAIMLTSIGFAMDQALTALFAFNLAAMTAAVVAGFLMDYLGSRGTLALSSACLAATVLLLGYVLEGEPTDGLLERATYLLVGAAGGFAGAGMASIYAMMATGYQVECRSGGLGFGMMLGRAGGILAAFGGGHLLDLGGRSTWPFLSILAAFAALGLGCAFVSDRHVRPAARESANPV